MSSARPPLRVGGAVLIALLVASTSACSSTKTTTTSTSTTGGGGTTTSTSGGSTTTVGGTTIKEDCPPASEVSSALGITVTGPTVETLSFGKRCQYKSSGAISPHIDFQKDTAGTFAAAEAAVPNATKVSGLGQGAFTTTGFVYVYDGGVSVKVLSPLSTSAQVQALAKQIVG
jgi:hypothetical protein